MIKKIFLLFVCLGVSRLAYGSLVCISLAKTMNESECRTDVCNDLIRLNYISEECCPNRERNKEGYSVLKQCPKGYYKSLNGCESCEAEIIGICAYETGGISYAQICEQCPNRILNKNGKCVLKQCPAERPARDSDGACRSCDLLDGFWVADEKDCLACPNRQMLNGKCVLKQCPDGNNVRNRYGSCLSCDLLDSIYVEDEKDCLACPNRRMLDKNLCVLKQCPDEKPLTGGGGCLACDIFVWTEDSKEICDKCPNRFYLEKGEIVGFKLDSSGDRTIIKTGHAGCYLKEHRENNYFAPLFRVDLTHDEIYKRNFDTRPRKSISEPILTLEEPRIYGSFCDNLNQYDCNHLQEFYSCDTEYSMTTLPDVCARCPNREYIDGACIRKYCLNGIMVGDMCKICSEISESDEVSKEECQKCPNRIYQDGKCIVGCPLGYKLNEYKTCVRKWYNFFDWLKVFR